MKKSLICFLLVSCSVIAQTSSAVTNADPLSETPLYPVPEEMSFEEYKDMNRRLSQTLLWSSIPFPGITHYYLGEKKMAKRLFYIGMGGLACIVGGSLSMGESSWPDFNENIHVIHNQGMDDERRYERVPASIEGEVIHYDLKEIYKQSDGGGSSLITLGIIIILGDFIYDRLRGLHLVEEKRSKVRYKYGKQLKLSYTPDLYFSKSKSELGLKLKIDLF